jgi:hypothetical protein
MKRLKTYLVVSVLMCALLIVAAFTEPSAVQQILPHEDSTQFFTLGITTDKDCTYFYLPGRYAPQIEGYITVCLLTDSINQVSADALDSLTAYARPIYEISNPLLALILTDGTQYVSKADSIPIVSLLDCDHNSLFPYPLTTAFGQCVGLCIVVWNEGVVNGDSFKVRPWLEIQ